MEAKWDVQKFQATPPTERPRIPAFVALISISSQKLWRRTAGIPGKTDLPVASGSPQYIAPAGIIVLERSKYFSASVKYWGVKLVADRAHSATSQVFFAAGVCGSAGHPEHGLPGQR